MTTATHDETCLWIICAHAYVRENDKESFSRKHQICRGKVIEILGALQVRGDVNFRENDVQ
jgi:hypothetical protein